MNRPSVIGMVVLWLLVASCDRFKSPKKEPSYEGKPVGYWIEQLKSKDPHVRITAASAFRLMVPHPKAAVPALIAALNDKERLVRTNAAAALGRMGPDAKAAIPALRKMQKSKDWPEQQIAQSALGSIIGASAN